MKYSIRKQNDFIIAPLMCRNHSRSQANQANNVFPTTPKKNRERTANKINGSAVSERRNIKLVNLMSVRGENRYLKGKLR
jgi:hypothetical protein